MSKNGMLIAAWKVSLCMGNIALLYAIRNGTIDLDCKDIWRHMQQQQLYSQLSFLTILIRGYFMGSLNSRKIMSFKNEYGRFFRWNCRLLPFHFVYRVRVCLVRYSKHGNVSNGSFWNRYEYVRPTVVVGKNYLEVSSYIIE